MDTRWMPLLAAGLGVLGGIAGALIGGNIANQGAEDRFQEERAAAIQDLRRDGYANVLGSAEEFAWVRKLDDNPERRRVAFTRFAVARARAILVAEHVPAIRRTTSALSKALRADPYVEADYLAAANSFSTLARGEISRAGK